MCELSYWFSSYSLPSSAARVNTCEIQTLDEKSISPKHQDKRLTLPSCFLSQTGVKKLNETNAMVEGLKKDLTKLEPVLEQASKDAEKLLKQVEVDKVDAAKVKAKVRHEYLYLN